MRNLSNATMQGIHQPDSHDLPFAGLQSGRISHYPQGHPSQVLGLYSGGHLCQQRHLRPRRNPPAHHCPPRCHSLGLCVHGKATRLRVRQGHRLPGHRLLQLHRVLRSRGRARARKRSSGGHGYGDASLPSNDSGVLPRRRRGNSSLRKHGFSRSHRRNRR